LGRSELAPTPYSIEQESKALYATLRARAPELAKAVIPMIEAYPDTANAMRDVSLPASLPIVDIVAENSWNETPAEGEAMKVEHKAFVAISPRRKAVFAAGSSHNVMRDITDCP